jgi:hypothetical protein
VVVQAARLATLRFHMLSHLAECRVDLCDQLVHFRQVLFEQCGALVGIFGGLDFLHHLFHGCRIECGRLWGRTFVGQGGTPGGQGCKQ